MRRSNMTVMKQLICHHDEKTSRFIAEVESRPHGEKYCHRPPPPPPSPPSAPELWCEIFTWKLTVPLRIDLWPHGHKMSSFSFSIQWDICLGIWEKASQGQGKRSRQIRSNILQGDPDVSGWQGQKRFFFSTSKSNQFIFESEWALGPEVMKSPLDVPNILPFIRMWRHSDLDLWPLTTRF